MATTRKNSHHFSIPSEVSYVTETLKKAGFEAYLVGGCVRDLILGKKPKDWDVTTNATPEEIVPLFTKTFYENSYGTVGVVDESTIDETLKIIEVTPYRVETKYSDNRRPDSVTFSKKLEDDLKRRDFTINAMAYDIYKGQLVDLYKGQEDLENKIIRTVGKPEERFGEDALRMIRALRLHAELDFNVTHETEKAIEDNANLLEKISKERIRDEFIRIIMSENPLETITLSHKLGVLKYIIPELEEGIGIDQTKAHAFDVWTHLLKSLQHAADKKWPLHIRLSALLHDISKPETRRWSKEGNQWTFYGHEVVGARKAEKILKRLIFSKEVIQKVCTLIRWHMFFSDTEQITLSAVRRMVSNVGKENVWDLINVRICDRIGTGRPKESPYRLRKYKSMIDEVMRDPISVGMLKIDGNVIIKELKIAPGPKIGYILHALLEEVLDDPKLNTEKYLQKKTKELALLSENDLKKLGEEGRKKKDEEEEKDITEIRKKHWVS
ncbi:MAG: HD domain-containing protein [Parcubacteria group bacterium]|nr:HD domain-containing protein [Parcubacteria group bacterium]